MSITENKHGFTIVELLIVIVVIAILAAITVVAYNGITRQAEHSSEASEISQWKRRAELYKIDHDISCPSGFVFVYGSQTLGTSDFCAMKYQAKNTGGVAVSQPAGAPWVNISQPTATVAAAAACGGCHLMTEAEWMTIAADVLTIKYNWSGGKVGSGFIYAGHNDGAPGAALEASDRDDDGYANTGNSGSSGPRQKRTLYLKSGDVIWDIAGNIYEWTEGVVSGSQPGVPADSSDAATYSWKQWGDSGMSWGSFPNISRPSQMATIPGLSDINTWDTSNGIGRLNSNRNQSAVRGYLRGGYWDNSTSAGVLTLALSRAPATELPYVGFRAAR